jgi:site-specific DNA recombinase
MNAPLLVPPKRCAVYCRVSSDERLDQSFNSIDAQKEAGHAFIKSQSHEGWIAVADDYDDGGFSGGNMERPALRRLMADIRWARSTSWSSTRSTAVALVGRFRADGRCV